MFYEDVKLRATDPSLSKLVWRYGHRTTEWERIWNHRKNIELRMLRERPDDLKPGDIIHIPIPWRVISSPISTHAGGVDIRINRNGGRGLRLKFVQTVNRGNQPFGPPDVFCTDPCTPDDPAGANEPFYRTRTELKNRPEWRKQMWDRPSRSAPSPVAGTTRWRAVTSIACITGKRVTVFDTKVWGFNLTPGGAVTAIRARDAKANEVQGHMSLLRKSAGGNFKSGGWTFRLPPVDMFGDFPISPSTTRTA